MSGTRMDVYLALLDAKKQGEADGVQLSPEESRLLDKMILDRTRNGLALEEDQRQKLIEVRGVAEPARSGMLIPANRSRRRSWSFRSTSSAIATRRRDSSSSPPRCALPSPALPSRSSPLAQELDGVPEDIISGYPLEDGKYRVTFKVRHLARSSNPR